MKRTLLTIFTSTLFCFSSLAQTTYYSIANGAWNNTNTWSTTSHLGAPATTLPGSVATDIVLIGSGHVVDSNPDKGTTNSATITTLTLDDDGGGGSLRFPFSNYNTAGTSDDLNTAFTLNVTGNVTLNAGGQILSVEGGSGTPVMNGAPANRTHTFNIGGNLSMNNASTFDMEASTTARKVNLAFNGSSNQTISGEATVDTWEVAYSNSGTAPNDRITNNSVNFTTSIAGDRSTFTSGTYVHNNTGTYTGEDNGAFTINTNLIIQDGILNMIVNHSQDRTGTINGDMTITNGRFNGGSNGAGIITNLTINGTLSVSGTGVLNVGEGDPGGPTYPTDATLSINGTGSTVNGATVFTHDLTLSAGTDLTISNGALFSVGNGVSTGNIAFNGAAANGSTMVINDPTTNFDVYGETDINEDSKWTINNGIVDIQASSTFAFDADPNAITLDVTGAALEINGGTVNVLTSSDDDGNAKALIFDADNTSATITGGTVNFGNTNTAQGNIRFRQGSGLTATLTISGGTVKVFDDFERNTDGAICNVSISNGAILNVGLGTMTSSARSELDGGTLTIADTGTDVNFGGPFTATNVVMTGLPTLDVGTNLTTVSRTIIEGTFTKSVANTILFESGFQIAPGASVSFNSGVVNIFNSSATMDGTNDDSFYIDGTFTVDGGTVNVGAGVTTVTSGRVLRIRDGSTVNINNGSLNILANAGLTSIAGGNAVNFENNGTGTNAVTIGDNSGTAGTAILQVAPNLAAELPSPSTRTLFDMDGANSLLTINSDGLLQVGGGNIGNLRLNTAGASIVQNGGIVNVTASLTVDDGTQVQVNGGTLNVGTSTSNGSNRIIFPGNPANVTTFSQTGGTVNVGDGNSVVLLGNGNTTPAFGAAAYVDFSLSGGTCNINGGIRVDDSNVRFRMSSGALNFNPQSLQNLAGTSYMLDLRRGIVGITGGTITLLNPNITSETGRAFRTNDFGTPTTDLITDYSALPGTAAVDFSAGTMAFGDGTELLDGSVDGFDLSLSPDHTYPTFIINNPAGNNRHVEIINSGNNYLTGGELTITAGIFDINDNTFERSLVGGTLTIGATGTLKIGNINGLNHFPGSTTGGGLAFGTYTMDINSTVEYDGVGNANVDIPGGPDEFGNLTISGSGNKTLSAAQSVRSVLTLSDGTFLAGTNLTMASASKILRTNSDAAGIMTGTVQGANDYSIEYTGLTKTTQAPEWSGSGAKSLIINLTVAEILTLHTTLTAGGDLDILSGTLEDAGTTFTVNGNITNSDTHTGTGKILINSGSATHTIGGDGGGIFSNLELDDASFDSQFTANQTINSVLTLTNGVFNIETYLLTLPTTASVSVASPGATRMIQVDGTTSASGVQKGYSGVESFTWPIGVSGKYTPATINVTATAAAGTITLFPVDTQSSFTTQDPPVNLEIDYYWRNTITGFSNPVATHTYTYDQGDATGRGNEAAYIPARYLPSSWTSINDVSKVDEVLNTISFTGVTYLDGDFTAGEPSEFGIVLTYYSRINGNWNTAATWSNVGFGGTASSTIPGSNRPVLIGDNDIITAAANGVASGSLDLQATGTLVLADGTTGHNFGTVIGTGLLQIISNTTTTPAFPGGTYTTFLGSSGGTVEYTGTGDYTLPSSPAEYNNLTISGASASTKIFPDADLTLNGNLNIGGTSTLVQISTATNGNLIIGGNVSTTAGTSLQFMDGNIRAVDINGNITNAGTIDVENVGSTVHTMNVAGNLTNTGTFDMFTSSIVNVTFDGSSNATISGAGAVTDFYRLVVNKGSSSTTVLNVTSGNLTLSGPTNATPKALEIQNGTFRISAAHTVTLSTNGDFSVPSTGGLSLNDAGAVFEITSGTSSLALAGNLEVIDGTVNIGDDATGVLQNDIAYTSGNAAIDIASGTLNVSGAIRGNPTSAALDYTQSGGLVNVARYKATTGNAGDVADFLIFSSSSSFTMSGGTLKVIRDNNTTDGTAIRIVSGVTNNVTGGTIQISESGTTGSHNIAFTTSVPFYNFLVGNGIGFTGNIGPTRNGEQNLTVLNDLTVNINGIFKTYQYNGTNKDNDNINLTIGGNFTFTNGSFDPGSDTGGSDLDDVIFNGSGNQVVTDAGGSAVNFTDLVINGTGTLQTGVNTDFNIGEDWTFTTGTFDAATNSRKVSFNGTLLSTITGNTTTFYDVEINNAGGVDLLAGSLIVSNDLTLTNGILNIAGNGLSLTNTAATAIQGGPFSTSNMIRTDGTSSASGVTKSYPNAVSNFSFPVGTDVLVYTPASINVTTAAGAGTITINPVNSKHPNAPGTDFIDYYWQIFSTGIAGTVVATHTYIYDQSDVNGTEANYTYGSWNGTNWATGLTSDVDESTNTITITGFTGQLSNNVYTAGAGFSNPVVYYSCVNGDWSNVATWKPAADCSGSVATEPQPNSPVIIRNHTISIVANNENAASIDLQDAAGILDLQTFSGHNFGVGISGIGTLQLESGTGGVAPTLPTLVASFVNTGGGTVEYTGATDYPFPSQTQYNDITISGTSTKTLANNISIDGDLSVSSGTLTLSTFSADRTAAGGTMTLSAGTQLNVDGVDNFPDNFSTYTLDLASTVRYSYNATTQLISDLGGGAYGNLIFRRTSGNPANKQLKGNIDVNGDLTIQRRVSVDANNFDITLAGDWSRDMRNNSAFIPGTGTITFDGSVAQTISITNGTEGEVFGNMIISNATGVSTAGNLNQLDAIGFTVSSGSFNLNNDPLILTGNFTNSVGAGGFLNPGTVTFNNTSVNQSINGAAGGTTFNNLTIAKAAGLTLTVNQPVSVNGTLNMSNDGNIVLSGTTNDVTIGTGGSLSGTFSANRMIVTGGTSTSSQLIQTGTSGNANSYDFTFPMGVGSDYTPVVIDASAITDAGNGTIAVRPVDGNNGQLISGEETRALNRYFMLDMTTITNITGSFSLTYATGDVQGTESSYLSRYWNGSAWTRPDDAAAGAPYTDFTTPASNLFGGLATTLISDANTEWTVGEPGSLYPKLYSNVAPSGNWTTVGSWAEDAAGITPATSSPTEENEVVIQNGDIINITVNTQSSASLEIETGATLSAGTTTGNDVGPLTGLGTLSTSSGNLPTYNPIGTTFFDAGNGTVDFTSASSYTLPSSQLNYNNLTISGGGTKTMGGTLTIAGNLVIDGTTLDADAANDYDITLAGSLSTPNSGVLIPRLGTFTLNGSSPQTLPALTFNNLIFDNTGTKSITSSIATLSNFTILPASGTVSTTNNINIQGNWSNSAGVAAFSSSATVTFDNTGALQTMSGATRFTNLVSSKNVQTLEISGNVYIDNAITLNNTVTENASVASTLNLNGSGTQDVGGTSSSIAFGSLVIDGPTLHNYNANMTINRNLTVTTGTFQSGSSISLNLSGDVTIGATATLDATNVTSINLEGDWTNGNVFTAGTGSVSFDGGLAQTITGATIFNDLVIINTSSGNAITLANSIVISGTGSMTFTDGLVASTSAETITFNSGSSTSGASAASYFEGAIIKLGTTAFTFPIGKSGIFARLGIEGTGASSTFSAEYFFVAGPNTTTTDGTFQYASGAEYWDLSRPAGTWDPVVTLYWEDNTRSEITDLGDLIVAHYNSGIPRWENFGNNGAAGPAGATGSVTSTNPLTNFSPVSFASINGINALPVEIIYFRASGNENSVYLEWETASEQNNDFFTLLRSKDGKTFNEFFVIDGIGNRSVSTKYSFVDDGPYSGLSYYKLLQTDFDGTETTAGIVSVIMPYSPSKLSITSFPNPFRDQPVTIKLSGLNKEETVSVIIVNAFGQREFIHKYNADDSGILDVTIEDVNHWASGVYIVRVLTEKGQVQIKIVKQ